MAFTDPVPAADFWETLRFANRPEFSPRHYQKQSLDGAGNALASILGQPKWAATIALAGGRHHRNLPQEADIALIVARGLRFLAYDIRRPYPAADMDGSLLGNLTVRVKSIGSNGRSLALKGLPKWFVVTKSDMQSALYSSTKRYLFQAEETVRAEPNGDTAEFEVWPFVPIGLAVDDVVTLRQGCGHFKIVAGSYRPSSGQGGMSSGISFSMISVP